MSNMPSISMAMIEIDKVQVIYQNGTRALAPTTLTIEKRRFTVLLGSSGAGRSTLLRTLNGLVRPTAGAWLRDKLK